MLCDSHSVCGVYFKGSMSYFYQGELFWRLVINMYVFMTINGAISSKTCLHNTIINCPCHTNLILAQGQHLPTTAIIIWEGCKASVLKC